MTVARLTRVRGNRGELAAESLTDPLERLSELRRVFLFGAGAEYTVEEVWFHSGVPIFKFAGVDTIAAAEPLRGAEVRIPFAERRTAEPGEYFISDLVGCEVADAATGQSLGRVTAFLEAGGPGVLEIDGNLLVPFVRSICTSIDVEARRIQVVLPEGLEEVNRS